MTNGNQHGFTVQLVGVSASSTCCHKRLRTFNCSIFFCQLQYDVEEPDNYSSPVSLRFEVRHLLLREVWEKIRGKHCHVYLFRLSTAPRTPEGCPPLQNQLLFQI